MPLPQHNANMLEQTGQPFRLMPEKKRSKVFVALNPVNQAKECPVEVLDNITTAATVGSSLAWAGYVWCSSKCCGLSAIAAGAIAFLYNTASVNKQFEAAEEERKQGFEAAREERQALFRSFEEAAQEDKEERKLAAMKFEEAKEERQALFRSFEEAAQEAKEERKLAAMKFEEAKEERKLLLKLIQEMNEKIEKM